MNPGIDQSGPQIFPVCGDMSHIFLAVFRFQGSSHICPTQPPEMGGSLCPTSNHPSERSFAHMLFKQAATPKKTPKCATPIPCARTARKRLGTVWMRQAQTVGKELWESENETKHRTKCLPTLSMTLKKWGHYPKERGHDPMFKGSWSLGSPGRWSC